MRRWFVFLLLSAMLGGCASPGMKGETTPEAERAMAVKYELPGTSREELFDKTLLWINATVVPKEGRLVNADRARGAISATVMTSYNSMFVEVPARYAMRIDFKDGRIRVTCYDFEDFWGEFKKTARPVEDADAMRELKQKARETGDALYAYLKGSPATKGDW